MILLMIIAIGLAFYEQSKAEKNVYIIASALVVFMFGMMRLSAKTPSKNQEKEDEHV